MQSKNTPAKLFDQVRDRIRGKHHSIFTEAQYVQWIKRFILFHGKYHPQEMGAAEAERMVWSSIQNQVVRFAVFV